MSAVSETPFVSARVTKEKTQHAEIVETITTHDGTPDEKYNEKNCLRIYRDGEDHEHEPNVNSKIQLPKPHSWLIDVRSPVDVPHCNVIPLDWIADSCLHLWWVHLC